MYYQIRNKETNELAYSTHYQSEFVIEQDKSKYNGTHMVRVFRIINGEREFDGSYNL